MSREWDDARLREAFASLSDTEPGSEVDTVRVWKAVAGELPAEERREVIDKVATDPAYAEAWRVATELRRASGESLAGVVVTVPARAPRAWRFSTLAAAAAALFAATFGVYLYGTRTPATPIYRGAIESLVASDSSLARDAFRLEWRAPAGARFDVRVTTEELTVIDQVTGLEATTYLVPEDRLQELSPGATIFWQVEATLSDGAVVESETFIVQLE